MIWLIGAHFCHDQQYYITGYMRHIHPRTMKQRARESWYSQENVDAIFIFVGQIHLILSSNYLRNMLILMGKGPTEAIYGPIGWKGNP